MFEPQGPRPITTREGWEDEYTTAGIWGRPVRSFYTDTPFYPEVPKMHPQFHVSFKLGWK